MKNVPAVTTTIVALFLGLTGPSGTLAATVPASTTTASSSPASADPISATDGVCDFSGQLAALSAVKKDLSLSDAQELHAELGLRRDLLSAAIACDQDGITARQDELSQLPESVKSMPVYQQITEAFANAARYYENQKNNIPDLGLQGTKDISRTIASWREGNYLPLAAWANDLILWAGNQQFFGRVSTRMTQVSRLAFSLKLVDQDQVTESFQKIQDDFQVATQENDAARDDLNQGQAYSALEHIKASLKSLSDTYQGFFDLQSTLQKIIQ